MDLARSTRLVLCLCLTILCAFNSAYEIPNVTIQVLSPKGFRASIPNEPNMGLFAFQGNINRSIGKKDVGTISGEVTAPNPEGLWVFEDPDVQLKAGDVINYYVIVSVGSVGYTKDNLKFTVANRDSNKECLPTLTKLRIGTACAGQTIFEDDFNTLNEDIWQIEHYIPENPDFPFVSYQHLTSDPTVSVVNGNLRIVPKLLQSLPGYDTDSVYSGSMNLFKGCTGSGTECVAEPWGANILPPVVSGRLTSRGLAFTYGIVHVRAKLPQGDWLYPELLLEPFLKKYGSMNYASGMIKIATARGNRELYTQVKDVKKDFGNKVLYGGPVMDFKCRNNLIKNDKKTDDGRMWGDDFHVYSVKWSPESITLLVDSKEWATIKPDSSGLKDLLDAKTCNEVPRDFLAMRSKMAPFDDHFYLTLGVAAGGISEFSDDLLNKDGRPKPWRNNAVKARLNFWNSMPDWFPTWNNAELLVDYVKVIAL